MEEKIIYKELSDKIIWCAVEVHRLLGPGLLESAYHQCLCRELDLNGIKFEREKPLPVMYKGCNLDCGYRLDILAEGKVILELKSVEVIKGIHEAQIISYMKLAGVKKGFLINFNVELLRNGLKSFAIK